MTNQVLSATRFPKLSIRARSRGSQSTKSSTNPKILTTFVSSLTKFRLTIFRLFTENILIEKKKVPGVGSYKTDDPHKKLARPATSLRIKRH